MPTKHCVYRQFEEAENGETETAEERNNKTNYEDKSQYQVTMRRHTVGPGDCTHEQVKYSLLLLFWFCIWRYTDSLRAVWQRGDIYLPPPSPLKSQSRRYCWGVCVDSISRFSNVSALSTSTVRVLVLFVLEMYSSSDQDEDHNHKNSEWVHDANKRWLEERGEYHKLMPKIIKYQ